VELDLFMGMAERVVVEMVAILLGVAADLGVMVELLLVTLLQEGVVGFLMVVAQTVAKVLLQEEVVVRKALAEMDVQVQ